MAASCRIAIVDDKEQVAQSLLRMLDVEGHDVRAFSSGANFLSAYESPEVPPPDIAFLDIRMPDMDGTELCRRAIEREKFDRTIFIALTGHLSLHDGCWLRPI